MHKSIRRYKKISRIFQAMAHPARLKLLHNLLEKECCVGELQKCLQISQPNTSQHLKILRTVGIVKGKKEKNRVCYRIVDKNVKQILTMYFGGEKKNG